jgi:uncharacterized SAM-binding protein YcdF (DUF218 family)
MLLAGSRGDFLLEGGAPDGWVSTRTLRWQEHLWKYATITLLVSIVVCGWLAREPLLRGAASIWVVSDPVTPADAIVVLGGNFQVRPFIAADLYHRGFAAKVLVSQIGQMQEVPAGLTLSDTELSIAALLKLGVPSRAVDEFGTANRNTRDEAVTLREWAKRNGASAFIIPTEVFSARRVRWIFDREFSGSSARIEVTSFEPPGYSRREWWKSEQGVLAFQNEIIKYIYYRLKY